MAEFKDCWDELRWLRGQALSPGCEGTYAEMHAEKRRRIASGDMPDIEGRYSSERFEARVREIASEVVEKAQADPRFEIAGIAYGKVWQDAVREIAEEVGQEMYQSHIERSHCYPTPKPEGFVQVPRAAWEELGRQLNSADGVFSGDWRPIRLAARACGLPGFEEKKDG